MTGSLLVALAIFACDDGDYDGDGWVEPADCDDNDDEVYPRAEERAYDGKDQDCNGTDLVDQDGDGFQGEEAGGPDCNDFRFEVHPGVEEVPYDGVDGDCDGWDDDDFDRDGFVARGYGGEDCDDFDPTIVPIDLDGDGTSPCTIPSDCDESDPLRNEGAEPICGNDIDDDCDDVSDCALSGILALDPAPSSIVGGADLAELGWSLVAPGDVTGDGVEDLVVSAERDADLDGIPEVHSLLVFDGLLAPGERGSETATSEITVGLGELIPLAAGDVDGDARGELLVGAPGGFSVDPRARLISPPPPGVVDVAAVTLLDVLGDPGDETGKSLARMGDHLVVGAPSRGVGEVQILPLSTRGTVAFGEDGAVIRGVEFEWSGAGVHAYDADADGTLDLLVGGPGDWNGIASAAYLLVDPPRSGAHDLPTVADARVDTHSWHRAGAVLASGDLDDDGVVDAVIGGPFADDHVGALAVFTAALQGDVAVDAAPIQRWALGDDSFGEALVVRDFDGDGVVDLVVGAPATWNSGGGAYKPGAVHVWYGPLVDGIEHTTTADLFLGGAFTETRTMAGRSLALADLDGDGGVDLAVGSPRLGTGVVEVFPGGQSGLFGM